MPIRKNHRRRELSAAVLKENKKLFKNLLTNQRKYGIMPE